MKTKALYILNILLQFVKFAVAILSFIPFFFGFTYFFMIHPNLDWIKMINDIPADRQWVLPFFMGLDALLVMVYIFTKFMTNSSKKLKDNLQD
jgi:hypothetical protein